MGSRRSSKGCQRTDRGNLRRTLGCFALLFVTGGTTIGGAQAAETPDDGLLEFLGSVDAEGKGFDDYLARTDVDRIARRAGNNSNPTGAGAPARPKPADPAAGQPPPAADKPPPTTAPTAPPTAVDRSVAPP